MDTSIYLSNRTVSKAEALSYELGCTCSDNESIARQCQLIFLCVKPQSMQQMLAGIAPILLQREDRFILVSIAAGLSMDTIQSLAGGNIQ